MSNFNEQLSAIAGRADQVLLPNRYQAPFFQAWKEITGRTIPETDDRRLSVNADGVLYRFLRGRDVPRMVMKATNRDPGLRTVGFSGSEWYEDYIASPGGDRRIQCAVVGEQMGRISLIASTGANQELLRARLKDRTLETIRVATAMPNLVRQLGSTGLNIDVDVALAGCVESGADVLGIPGVDSVVSGRTLQVNGFVEVEPLAESWPVLVAPQEMRYGK